MHIKIKKNKFKKHLNNISKALSNNPALISLKGIKFKVKENKIIMITSDGVLSIKETIISNDNLKIIKTGEILIPGKILIEVIKKQDELIEMIVKNNTLIINSKLSNTKINLINLKDYPKIDFDLIGDELIVDSQKIRNAIKKISFAASENNKRIILNGVNLIANNGNLIISATDSYRLASKKIKTISKNNFNITVLAKNIKDFIPSYVDGEIRIKVDESKINFKNNNTTIQSRLIDGIYPELSKLIPKKYNFTFNIETKEFLNLIDKTTVISNAETKTVKFIIQNNQLILKSKQEEIGDSCVILKKYNWEGSDFFSIVFNSKFVKEALKCFGNKISIKFISELKPFVIVDELNNDLIHLILPHRDY